MTREHSISLTGAEGNRIAGTVWDGGGQPVILLHGGGQTRHAWQGTAARLAARGMRAIAVDGRGHGESDWVESGHYSFVHYAEDVAELAKAVEAKYGERPAIVGASLGGIAALIAEMRFGPLMESLVLVDIVPQMNPDGVARVTGFMGERLEEGFGSLEEAADAISAYLPNRKPPRSLDGLRKNLRLGDDGRYRWHWDPAFMRGPGAIQNGARAVLEDVVRRLPALDLPVLLVRGMQSELVGEDAARAFVAQTPNARYIDVGGAGHMVAGDRNDVFSAAVIEFFAGQKTPA